MVADFEEGRILGELQDLEDEIQLLQTLVHPAPETESSMKLSYVLTRIINRLQNDKYYQEMRLKIHRQKVKERGIKF